MYKEKLTHYHKTYIASDSASKICKISRENPGARIVLTELYTIITAQHWDLLLVKMDETNTPSYALWEVYKDICNRNIDKTAFFVRNWVEAVHCDKTVNEWVKSNLPY